VYLTDIRNGATMLTIPFGHSVDALCYCLGEFAEFSATMATGRPIVKVRGTGDTVTMTAADQLAVAGKLAGGAVAAVQYKGGRLLGTNLLWEITGTEGELQVSGPLGHVQLTVLTLKGGKGAAQELQPMAVPESYRHTELGLPTTAVNVAEAYRLIEGDMRNGTRLAPSFDVAVARHRMIEAVVEAAKTGMRQKFA
jgi:predicted dehydrogenase